MVERVHGRMKNECVRDCSVFRPAKFFFDAKTTFSVNFHHKMFKKPQKVTIKHLKKGVLKRLGVTLKAG